MAVDIVSLVVMFSVSFVPFIIIGAARWRTLIYRLDVQKGNVQHDPSKIPRLV